MAMNETDCLTDCLIDTRTEIVERVHGRQSAQLDTLTVQRSAPRVGVGVARGGQSVAPAPSILATVLSEAPQRRCACRTNKFPSQKYLAAIGVRVTFRHHHCVLALFSNSLRYTVGTHRRTSRRLKLAAEFDVFLKRSSALPRHDRYSTRTDIGHASRALPERAALVTRGAPAGAGTASWRGCKRPARRVRARCGSRSTQVAALLQGHRARYRHGQSVLVAAQRVIETRRLR
jgi:hypothetical protein